jgi:DNA-binding NtrC family response regulator
LHVTHFETVNGPVGPDARIPVIFITATNHADSAIEAIKQGTFDYLLKPLDTQPLRRVAGQALELSRPAR